MDLKKTGELIAESRKALGLTQKQLADAIGVTDKAISRWETGRGFPDAAYLQPLAQTLGLSVTEIVNGELTQPEIAAKQADDALLSALKYSRQMGKTVAAVLLAIAGVALLASPLYVLGEEAAYLPVLGVFFLALAAVLQFCKNGPSTRLAQLLAGLTMVAAVVLQVLPISAVLVFRGPTYYNRNLYSCFDLTLVGYANGAPFLSAVLTVVILVLMAVVWIGKKNGLRNGIFVCTIVSGALMLVPPVLFGLEYLTAAGLAITLLQFISAALQARANGSQ